MNSEPEVSGTYPKTRILVGVHSLCAGGMHYKYDGITGKQILREVVHGYLQRTMVERPKTGFSFPIMKWLREDLSPLLSELLSNNALKDSTSVNPRTAQRWLHAFQAGDFHYSPLVWATVHFSSLAATLRSE